MPVSRNGVARKGELAPIPHGRMAKEAAPWFNAMVHAAAHDGILIEVVGPVSSFRPIAAQNYFWNHRPPPAAFPGTSNHGWGLADDLKMLAGVFAWLSRNAHKFGFSHDEGARVGEAWHWRFVGGGSRALLRKWGKPLDKLAGLSSRSRKLVDKLHYHRRGMRKEEVTGRGAKYKWNLKWARWYKKRILKTMAKLRRDAYKNKHGHTAGWKEDGRGKQYHILKLVYEGKL